jgi:hypothetical protein
MSASRGARRSTLAGALLALGLALGLVLGLALGSTTGAVAGSLGPAAVKKLVKKQVAKLAPTLSVGDAARLGGTPASGYVLKSGVRADGVATSADIDVTTGPVVLLSKSLTAPTDGYVFAVATLSGRQKSSGGGYGLLQYRLEIDGTPVTPDAQYHQLVTHDENFGADGAVSAVLPVTAGTHTIGLLVSENGAGTTVTGRDLSLLFTPSGSAATLPY